MSQIANITDHVLFVVKEATPGVGGTILADDAIFLNGTASFVQQPIVAPDKQHRKSRSMLPPVYIGQDTGTFSFNNSIKPSGTAGTGPEAAVLYEVLLGTETIVGGTSVTYTPKAWVTGIQNFDTALIVFAESNVVFWNYGCVLNTCTFNLNTEAGDGAIANTDWSGLFLKQKRAGSALLDGVHAAGVAAINLVANGAKEFQSETRVMFIDSTTGASVDDNGGLGFLCTASTEATDILTIAPVTNNITTGSKCVGWIPVGTEVGNQVSSRLGGASLLGVAIDIINPQVTINSNLVVLNDEKTNDIYPVSVVPGDPRTVVLTFQEYLEDGLTRRISDAINQLLTAIIIPVGNVAGSILTINLPQSYVKTTQIEGDPARMNNNEYICAATASFNDEISLAFT